MQTPTADETSLYAPRGSKISNPDGPDDCRIANFEVRLGKCSLANTADMVFAVRMIPSNRRDRLMPS
jgi:hypothetical protein